MAAARGANVEWSPDGQWLVFERENRLYRVARDGGEPLLLAPTGVQPLPRFSRDGQSIYYHGITGPREQHDFWKLSLNDDKVSRVTTLEGRRGNIGSNMFATDGRYLYFTGREDDGDIWVMDVVPAPLSASR